MSTWTTPNGQSITVPDSEDSRYQGSGYTKGGSASMGGMAGGVVNNPQAPDPGRPVYPTLESYIGGSTGSPKLLDNLVLNPNWSTGFSGLQSVANAKPGEGTWEQMMLQKNALDQSSNRDEGARSNAAARATGFSDLARRGGISSGASSRLAKQGGSDLMSFLQGNERAGATNRLNIGAQAETNRMGALKDVMGTELNAQQFNTQNLLTQKRLEDAAKLGKYGEEMKAYGADKTANATANSGGGLSWICTELHKASPFSDFDWRVLGSLRKYFKMTHPAQAEWYFVERGKYLVEDMITQHVDFEPFRKVVKSVIAMGAAGDYNGATLKYWKFVSVLADIYSPDLNCPEYDPKAIAKAMQEERVPYDDEAYAHAALCVDAF